MNTRSKLVGLARMALRGAPVALMVTAAALVTSSTAPAHAEGPAPTETCEYRGLLRSLQQLALVVVAADGPNTPAQAITFELQRDRVSLVDAVTREPLFIADCHGATLPAARPLQKKGPDARPARTLAAAGRTVSLTAKGAASLDIDAGALFSKSFHILTFDDGSVSLAFGNSGDAGTRTPGLLLYEASTNGLGDFVEKQDISVGCGCERWVTATGDKGERPFTQKR